MGATSALVAYATGAQSTPRSTPRTRARGSGRSWWPARSTPSVLRGFPRNPTVRHPFRAHSAQVARENPDGVAAFGAQGPPVARWRKVQGPGNGRGDDHLTGVHVRRAHITKVLAQRRVGGGIGAHDH